MERTVRDAFQHDSSLPLAIGEVLADRYDLLRVIGRGAVGVVYEANHRFTEQRVAIKALNALVSDYRDRMEAEAKSLARVRHPHVVTVHDGGVTEAGVVWFAMDLLHGVPLRSWMHRRTELDLDIALAFGAQAARGLAACHHHDIIHRDVKPENLFVLEPELEIRVLDFGTAKFPEGGLKTTDHNRVIGTTAYMAPERLLNNRSDARGDIYSLGHVLYELFTGWHCLSEGPGPLDLPGLYELGMVQIVRDPPSMRMHVPWLPESLDDLVLACLAKELDDRPPSMAIVADLLELERAKLLDSPAKRSTHRPRPPSPDPDAVATESDTVPPSHSREQVAPARVSLLPGPVDPAQPVGLTVLRAPYEQPWTDPAPPPGLETRPPLSSSAAHFIYGSLRLARQTPDPPRIEELLLNALAREPVDPGIVPTLELCLITLILSKPAEQEWLARQVEAAGWPHSLATRACGTNLLRMAADKKREECPEPYEADGHQSLRVALGAVYLLPEADRDPRFEWALHHVAELSRSERVLFELSVLGLAQQPPQDQVALREDLLAFALEGGTPERDRLVRWLPTQSTALATAYSAPNMISTRASAESTQPSASLDDTISSEPPTGPSQPGSRVRP